MKQTYNNYAIILASGNGTRFGSNIPKQFTEICGKTVLERAVEVFEKNKNIDKIIVVITSEYLEKAQNILQNAQFKKIFKLLKGGGTRRESSFLAISSIEELEANVLIHDCARPFVTEEIINDCIKSLEVNNAVGVAIPATDTIIEVENSEIKSVPARDKLWQIQTPQCFRLSLIKKAHEISKNDFNFTDDCGLIVRYNLAKVKIVKGTVANIKITYPLDYLIAESILKERESYKL